MPGHPPSKAAESPFSSLVGFVLFYSLKPRLNWTVCSTFRPALNFFDVGSFQKPWKLSIGIAPSLVPVQVIPRTQNNNTEEAIADSYQQS